MTTLRALDGGPAPAAWHMDVVPLNHRPLPAGWTFANEKVDVNELLGIRDQKPRPVTADYVAQRRWQYHRKLAFFGHPEECECMFCDTAHDDDEFIVGDGS